VFGEPLSGELYHRYLRIVIARETGWTLDEVDRLGVRDWLDVLAVAGGMADVDRFRAQGL
jgi:hypothetical protein